jgi:TetR/AcrR family transcriptional regulator
VKEARATRGAWAGAVPAAETQHDLKRQVLLRQAAASFNRAGYHGTSLADIAQTLGVSKAALYTYVKSKDELLYFCHQAALDGAFASLATARGTGGTGLRQLVKTLEGYLRLVTGGSSFVILLEENALQTQHIKAIVRRRDQFERELRALVERGMADGSIVPCNPKLAVFAALGAINWVQKWYAPGGEWSGEQLAVALGQYLERMLGAGQRRALPIDPGALKT